HPTIFFDSHAVSKEGCSSHLSELDEGDKKRPAPRLLDERVGAVVRDIRRKTDISLFGLDFIVEKETGFHYIIDVNNFPSYDGVKYFYHYLVDLIVAALTEKELKLLTEKSNPLTAKSLDDSALLLHRSPKMNPFLRINRVMDGDQIAAVCSTSKVLPPSKLTSIIDEPNFLLLNGPSSTAANTSVRSASSKSMSEYLLDSGIGSSSCTESDNSDSERKLLKVLKLNQQRYRSAQQQTIAQKPSTSLHNDSSASTTTSAAIVTTDIGATHSTAVNIRTPRGRSGANGGGGAASEKFATISTPTAAYAERERQLRHEQQQQQLAENWSRIKQFYGIPKPFFVKKMTGEF
uniref:inositol-1,3,4-trisphosphate 5/6-kinase n=1 Tax=Romanomermis culicivorax TaxID=13658 RepID=A0A915KHN8_ROMCU